MKPTAVTAQHHKTALAPGTHFGNSDLLDLRNTTAWGAVSRASVSPPENVLDSDQIAPIQVPSTEFKIMASRRNHRILPEAILLWLLEVLGALTAIFFGVFGVMPWKAADEANGNSRSNTANLVALVALCAKLGTGDDVSSTTPGDSA